MADEERDAGLSAADDETDASDDTDQRSSDGDADDADDASSSSDGPVYGRVTPRDETVTHGSDDDASADVAAETGDNGDDSDSDTDAAPDDADDSATDSDADSDDEPRLLADDEHTSHVPEGTYDDSSDESADDVDPDAAADGASPALTGEDEMGGVAPSSVSAEDADFDDEDVGGLVGEAPESDQEMPLTAHIEEMIRRLAVVLGVAGAITLVLFPGADILNALVDTQAAFGVHIPSATDVINFLWNSHIPGAETIVDRRPRLYGPLELILTKLKVAGLAGTVIGLPVFVYETYLFMRPGLYPKERKYYLAAVPTSLVLALVGVLFAHFVVLPAIFAYFTSYTEGTAVVAFGLKETFNLILILMGYMAVVFQIPLFVELAIMMNLVTRRWLEDRRLLFWGAFLGLAFLVSPDPTGMAPIIIGATMITLFEGTLAALRWTGN
ncbi:Sec-independent protein translocase protein TatCo [Haloferax volcanii]|uniref:Sec-independent protein translocase protein TatCo n=3 Tax=Haloferax volcanii TaxID=2246 RepID=TATCO_HALVD|nr:Sec-independent protein translocase protein TatCo [Haloferax volcanii]D4GZD0.1 RecName: Full=Sec-independent protein translocase protein TatCo [Haloferax volcanii DS2]ADE04167.1 Sec-independent protein translocase protein TatCo [Haloferax volcanii DS2]ELY23878.1 twin arginine translocation system subunit TatCo [Haloferax volcanii DS2]MBS8118643.1 preprotein translocase subunit TatC [Haloferax volcanii]MBS8123657.1 preprotein translocase subunit TatC [Haloferax volcanii]MBS8127526.1 preprot